MSINLFKPKVHRLLFGLASIYFLRPSFWSSPPRPLSQASGQVERPKIGAGRLRSKAGRPMCGLVLRQFIDGPTS